MSQQSGRKACPQCGRRDTEITYSTQKKQDIECHHCNNEWTDHTGPDCPACNSQNTRRVTVGHAPHQSTEIRCYNCSYNQ